MDLQNLLNLINKKIIYYKNPFLEINSDIFKLDEKKHEKKLLIVDYCVSEIYNKRKNFIDIYDNRDELIDISKCTCYIFNQCDNENLKYLIGVNLFTILLWKFDDWLEIKKENIESTINIINNLNFYNVKNIIFTNSKIENTINYLINCLISFCNMDTEKLFNEFKKIFYIWAVSTLNEHTTIKKGWKTFNDYKKDRELTIGADTYIFIIMKLYYKIDIFSSKNDEIISLVRKHWFLANDLYSLEREKFYGIYQYNKIEELKNHNMNDIYKLIRKEIQIVEYKIYNYNIDSNIKINLLNFVINTKKGEQQMLRYKLKFIKS